MNKLIKLFRKLVLIQNDTLVRMTTVVVEESIYFLTKDTSAINSKLHSLTPEDMAQIIYDQAAAQGPDFGPDTDEYRRGQRRGALDAAEMARKISLKYFTQLLGQSNGA